MPLATGVQILTCIRWLDMLAHSFEFGGVGGAVGGLCCMIQHHLLLTYQEGLTIFIQTVNEACMEVYGGLIKHKCPNNPQLLEGKPDATGYWCTNSNLHWMVRYACTWF